MVGYTVTRNFYGNNSPKVIFQGAAKGGQQKEFSHFFIFGTLLVTFWSLFLTLLSLFSSLFCQTPFAGLLLRQGEFCIILKLDCAFSS